jgi:hypothetical protein
MEGDSLYAGSTVFSTSDPASIERGKALGLVSASSDAPAGSSVTIENLTVAWPHSLIFCFSRGPYAAAKAAMCQQEACHLNYDASVSVDPQALRQQVMLGAVRMSDGSDVKAVDAFSEFLLGDVTYETRVADIGGTHVLTNSPFAKSEKYRDQCETRLVLKPHDPRFPDRVKLSIPDPHLVFQPKERAIKDINVCAGPDTDPETDPRVVEDRLINLADEIEIWDTANVPAHPFTNMGPRFFETLSQEERSRRWQPYGAEMQRTFKARGQIFGDRVARAYWDARLLRKIPDAGVRHILAEPDLLFDNTSDKLREIAAAIGSSA